MQQIFLSDFSGLVIADFSFWKVHVEFGPRGERQARKGLGDCKENLGHRVVLKLHICSIHPSGCCKHDNNWTVYDVSDAYEDQKVNYYI